LKCLTKLFKRNKKEIIDKEESKYPIKLINEYVNKYIYVDYIDLDIPKNFEGTLLFESTDQGFYMGNPENYYLICWDWKSPVSGKEQRSYIVSIKDSEGNLIWRRDD